MAAGRLQTRVDIRTGDGELARLKHFLDDLRNVVKPRPVERFAMDVNMSVAEIVESMRGKSGRTGVAVGFFVLARDDRISRDPRRA